MLRPRREPYWGLRDYGVPGQLGLEPTFGEYLAKLVEVFHECRRVLRKDGTCWVNMGDSYASTWSCGRKNAVGNEACDISQRQNRKAGSIKDKDLIGQPWRLAFALQDAGWFLRSDIIWHKPNPMPESVRDRPTRAHEYIFLLTKSAKYWYDASAIAEPCSESTHARLAQNVEAQIGSDRANAGGKTNGNLKAVAKKQDGHGRRHAGFNEPEITLVEPGVNPKARKAHLRGPNSRVNVNHAPRSGQPQARQNESFSAAVCCQVETRNSRSVWTIGTEPYKEAHFAVFPTEIPRRCILAGCPENGTVLDPFGGSGTTGAVARELGRQAILIELNPEYVGLIRKRLLSVNPPLDFSGPEEASA